MVQVVIKPENFSIRRVGMSFLDYLLGPMAKDGEAATHSIGRDYEEDAGSPGAEKKTFPEISPLPPLAPPASPNDRGLADPLVRQFIEASDAEVVFVENLRCKPLTGC